MNIPNNLHIEHDTKNVDSISVFVLNKNECNKSKLEIDNNDFEYPIESVDTIERLFSIILNFESHYALTKVFNIVIMVDVTYLNEELINFIEYAKLNYKDNIHFVYYSDNDSLSDHLKCVRNFGEAFLPLPIDSLTLLETINSLIVEQEEEYRVLFIDDDESIGMYYKNILKKSGINCRFEKSADKVLSAFREFKPDLFLVDYYMPHCSGDELVKMMRQRIDIDFIPIVYLSAETNSMIQLQSISDGVDDFLNKSLKPEVIIENIKSRIKRARRVHSLTMKDSLTQLNNHAMIKNCVELEISRSIRNLNEFCFVIIDIDHFKSINDQYGHSVGDKVLKTLSCFFKKNIRKSDIIGRYGGEEFAIIFPDTSKESTFYILNNLKEQFSNIKHRCQNLEFNVTFSAGISSFPEQTNPSELFEQADKFLYQAKNSGRNKISF